MGVRHTPRKHSTKPWLATGRIRDLRLDVFLGYYATQEEARAAVDAWFLKKYGGKKINQYRYVEP